MKILIGTIIFLLTFGCSKPKTVFICGDHVCINNDEAEQYFEENLSLEVKIIDKKQSNEIDLVQLNLRKNDLGKKKINIVKKKETTKKIKILSNDEIEKKKEQLKKRKKINKNVAKLSKKNKEEFIKEKKIIKNKQVKKTVSKSSNDKVDVCTIVKKCNIEEISKYLIKLGKSKDFPDISIKQ